MTTVNNELAIIEEWAEYLFDYELINTINVRKVKKKAGDREGIRKFLDDLTKTGNVGKKDIGLIIKTPYGGESEFIVAGPTFAALLIKDYELAAKVLKWEKKPNIYGCFLDLGRNKDWTEHVSLVQLFAVDLEIPSQLAELLRKKMRKEANYNPDNMLFYNYLLKKADEEFARIGEGFYFGPDDHVIVPYAKKLVSMRKAYPSFFEDMMIRLKTEQYICSTAGSLNSTKDISSLFRFLYRYYAKDRKTVIRYFAEQTKVECYQINNSFFDEPLPRHYVEDASLVYKLVKDDEDDVKEYLTVLLYVSTVTDNRQINRIIKRLLGDPGRKTPDVDELILDLSVLSDRREFREIFSGSSDGYTYMKYLGKIVRQYARMTAKRICVSSDGNLMKQFYIAVNDMEDMFEFRTFDITEEQMRAELAGYRNSIKDLLSVTEIKGENSQPKRTEEAFLKLSDEELLVQLFEKKILSGSKSSDYIKKAIKNGQLSLVPCITAFSENNK